MQNLRRKRPPQNNIMEELLALLTELNAKIAQLMERL